MESPRSARGRASGISPRVAGLGSAAGDIGNQYAAAAQTDQFQQVVADPAVQADPDNATVLKLINAGSIQEAQSTGVSLDDTSFLKRTNAVLAAPFEEGFSVAITRVLFISALIAIGGLLFAIFVPQVPLREKSGLETMRDEEDSDEEVPGTVFVATEM